MATNKNKHLTQDDRNVIAIGIVNGSSKKAIADNLGKDKSTIGKEIRAHRYLSHKSTLSLECENYAHCKFKRKNCTVNCPDYSKFRCKRRDRTPGACNGCAGSCHFFYFFLFAGKYLHCLISIFLQGFHSPVYNVMIVNRNLFAFFLK